MPEMIAPTSADINVGFVIMIEPGDLEWQGILLISTMLAFVRDRYRIHVYCRTELIGKLSGELRSFLDRHGLQLKGIENPFSDHYPNGNKVVACTQKRPEPFTIFLDTDTAFVRPCSYQRILSPDHVVLVPAGIASWGQDVKNWERVYDVVGLPMPIARTFLGNGKYYLPYFNAGFVAYPTDSAFANTWLDAALKIDADDAIADKRPWLDQIALPAAIFKSGLLPLEVDRIWNHGINNDSKFARNVNLVHYHHSKYLQQHELEGMLSAVVRETSEFENFRSFYRKLKVRR